MIVRRFIAQSLKLSPFHLLDMTRILLEGTPNHHHFYKVDIEALGDAHERKTMPFLYMQNAHNRLIEP